MKFKSRAELTRWALGSHNLWLFLDYDGTLADFAPTPEVIEPNPRIINTIERLVHISTIRVTVMSGRKLRDLHSLLPITGIFVAGTYGVELQKETGETIDRVEYRHIRPVLEAIKPQWEQFIDGRRGFFLEDKGWTLALHARFADEDGAEQILRQAQKVAEAHSINGYFRILGGHRFVEIASLLASKRETVAYLLIQYPLPDARLLYIGDDDKDEEVFPLLHTRQGVAVKVFQPSQVSRPTEADFFFESPEDTLQWLDELICHFE